MTSKLSLSSSVSSATLVAINSISATAVAADYKQNHHAAAVVAAVAADNPLKVVSVEQAELTSAIDNNEREDLLFSPKSSTAVMKPDVGILSKDFFKSKGREQPIDKQFAIHRKKQAAAADVDVGILSNGGQGGRQWQTSRANLHAKNVSTGRSLQSEEEFPYMCPGKYGYGGWRYFSNLFNQTDSMYFTEEGYFPKCSCSRVSPTTCGPTLCECLELDADGDILQCMDSFKQLCEGAKYIDGVPGPWSMEKCLGETYGKFRAIYYCSMLPCFVEGGSYWQCICNMFDNMCTVSRDTRSCARSKCCQAQTDDEGREACLYGGLHENYYDQVTVTSFSLSPQEMITRFNECSFNSDHDKSIVECYCESFSHGRCVNSGVVYPDICEAMNCCYEQTEDDAKLDCFTTHFRDTLTGWRFYDSRDTIQESCIASGRSSDQCKCDIQGLSNCVFGIGDPREPNCDLFQCCQAQADDDDEGRKYCLVQDKAEQRYERCLNDNNTTESCVCDKSNTLCSSGHSNDRHCELSSCCQEQTDDTGRKECIGNFTTSQPSSAPSGTTPAENSIDEPGASPTAASALPDTSSASIPTPPLGAKSHAKATTSVLAVAAITVWLLLTS